MDVGKKYASLAVRETTDPAPAGGINLDSMYVQNVYFGMGRYFDLTPTEALLLATVHSLSKDGRDWCYMSQEHIGTALNISLTTVNTLLEELRESELLEKGGRHLKWNTYLWRLTSKALDRLRYIQAQIAKSKGAKARRV